MLAMFTTVKAQTKSGTAPANEFVNTQMAVSNGSITFSGIPAVKKPVYAIITNTAGDIIKQTRVSPEQHVMDIQKLHTGLYFVTIVYRDQNKKAFTLNL